MTDTTIVLLPAAPLHALEIWSRPQDVAARIEAVLGVTLPSMGRSASGNSITLIRFEPTVWLIEGDAASFAGPLGEDGALTAIGGGIVRVRISGPGWRALLMEGAVFDAEAPGFAPGCSAATIVDHVAVRLWVESEEACIAYVPASYAVGIVHFWNQALLRLAA